MGKTERKTEPATRDDGLPSDRATCLRDFTIPVPDIPNGTDTRFAAGQEVTDPAILTLFVRYLAPVSWQ